MVLWLVGCCWFGGICGGIGFLAPSPNPYPFPFPFFVDTDVVLIDEGRVCMTGEVGCSWHCVPSVVSTKGSTNPFPCFGFIRSFQVRFRFRKLTPTTCPIHEQEGSVAAPLIWHSWHQDKHTSFENESHHPVPHINRPTDQTD